mgnify:CR=1 FL=1
MNLLDHDADGGHDPIPEPVIEEAPSPFRMIGNAATHLATLPFRQGRVAARLIGSLPKLADALRRSGELDEALTWDEFVKADADYAQLFDHDPELVACDLHPDYRSSRHAAARGRGPCRTRLQPDRDGMKQRSCRDRRRYRCPPAKPPTSAPDRAGAHRRNRAPRRTGKHPGPRHAQRVIPVRSPPAPRS